MTAIAYQGKRFTLLDNETVLDGLLRNGVEIPHACRSGVCRSCTMVASAGPLPEAAQAGLREVERRHGMFLACLCRPQGDLELRDVGDQALVAASVVEVAHLSDSVVRLRLQCEEPFDYEAGQYISLRRLDNLARSYSLASTPNEPYLELHIRRVPEGRMSNWAYHEVRPGMRVALRGPYGTCCYVADQTEAPILMVGVGTGLAPLWGVLRQALASGHTGPITLIQAAAEPAGLYMREELRELARTHSQLRIRTCVLRGGGGELVERAVDALAVEHLREAGNAAAHLGYVCGDATVVQRVRRGLFMAGMSARRIFVDAFVSVLPPAAASV
ncbi:MAG TPA: FAD-binding oxidoreductase [Enhygromyxa sp.]|nr:FAD-binding oxidoreductase [Enhygromyxa sp.]